MYYLISIQKLEETTAQSIFAYEDKTSAMSAYHSTLASNYASTTLNGFCVMVINEHGGTEIREYWEKPYTPPEPEPEPEPTPEGEGE